MTMKSIYVALFIALASVFIASCGGSDDPQVDVAGALVTETPNISVEQKEPEIGCKFDNPSCDANSTCIDDQCIQNLGCMYENPECTLNESCVDNVCVRKQGCDYDNPMCNNGLKCIDNKCIFAVGCNWDNPPCNTTTQICQNNECVPKPGCQNNNPSCTFGQFCQNNKCIGTATGVIGHPEKNDMWGELQTVEESGVDLGKQKD